MFLIGLLSLRHVLPARQNMIRVGATASKQSRLTMRPPDAGVRWRKSGRVSNPHAGDARRWADCSARKEKL